MNWNVLLGAGIFAVGSFFGYAVCLSAINTVKKDSGPSEGS